MRLVLSTRNAHKVREFAGLLDGVDVAPLPDSVVLPPETGETFEAIAIVKARTADHGPCAPPDETAATRHV